MYKFNGSVFDDAAAPDIAISGFAGKAVYDLAYDESKKLLYASGDGFVASFDISSYCPTTLYNLNVVPNCLTSSVSVTVSPAPPVGSTVTYILSNGGTQVATNTTGIFSGLLSNVTYTVIATINQACSGTQATTTFLLPGPAISMSQTNTLCGASTGTINAVGSATLAPYSYSIDGITFQASGSFTGLTAGVYTITVKDANGCKSIKAATLLNSNGPILTYTNTNADCGNNNGTITAGASGGTAPYQYSTNGTIYQSGNFFTGLVGGTYTLMVKDAAGCINSAVVTITSSQGPLITAIPAAATCGSSNGTITAFGSGGTGALQYSINGNTFQAGNVFLNLTPGSYTVVVKDDNGCTKSTVVTLANSPAPTVTALSAPAACNNINGTITATGNGGIAPLQYSIDGTTFQTSNIFTGLASATYTITVKDATGCTNFVAATVLSTNGPTATAISVASACNINNGSITATGSGGLPGYQYSINGSTFQAGKTFLGLAAGNYVVYVKDAAGCIGTAGIVVDNTIGPSLSATSTASACNANTATITANASGGALPYQFSIDGNTYQAGNVFIALAAGDYSLYVKDNNGCIKTVDITVANVAGLSLNTRTITSACNGNSGTITALASGGVGPLLYSIDGVLYQPGNVFNNLTPGIYTLYVKDVGGCIVTKQAVVDAVAGPSITVATPIDVSCTAASGVIIITGSNGAGPYTFSINGSTYQVSDTFINVAAGNYTAYVKDAKGCIATQAAITISSSAGAGISTFTVNARGAYVCNGGTGRITNPRVNGANCNTCTFSLNFGPFVPNVTQLFLGLAPATYTVTAMDANGCTKTINAVIGIAANSTATAVVTATACNTTNGKIALTGIGPNTPYHASISGIGGPWVTFDPGYTFTGLAPGTYTIILSDDESFDSGPPVDPGGCLDTITVIVPAIGGPAISTLQNIGSCGLNNGSITASATGGAAPYTFNVDGGSFFTSGVFNNIAPGVHTVSVKDATGCISVASVTLAGTAGLGVNATVQPTTCNLNNASVNISATGGTAPFEFSINGTTFEASNIFNGMTAGNYILYAKDSNGCYGTLPVTIAKTALPKAAAFSIAATCGNMDGVIVINGSLGIPPYVFSIDGTVFQSNNRFNKLAAGFYTIYIKDSEGCMTTTGVTVSNISGPAFTSSSIAATCTSANGNITINASGGTAPYDYSIDGTTFQSPNLFAGLAPGNYTLTVRDGVGCRLSKSLAVANVSGPQVLTATVANAACGLSNGTITSSASGSAAPLQYSINGTTYQASGTFNGVAAGAYTLYVKDVNGCIKTLPVSLLNLSPPVITATSSPSSCGSADGTITAIATGGTLPITYSKNGSTFQTSNIFLNLANGPYTITAKDGKGCTATFDINVSVLGTTTTPTFSDVSPICRGATLAALPTTSLNGITGTWSPALNNTATTTYTFAPSAGQCATTASLTITVNPNIAPTFTTVSPICSGATLAALPTTSLNGITGTWSPALNNTATTTYTFAPSAGQCATTASLAITVNPNIAPTFTAVSPICSGATLAALPTTSLNGITGTWSPALNNTATTTYTFAPSAGQCATTTSLAITVNPNITPTFTAISPICSGAALAALPITSLNGITGTWSPALNNTTTTTYTFTSSAGQCATTASLTITVNPLLSPTINCGVSTSSSVSFNWAAVSGATGYSLAYQINAGAVVNVGAIGNVLTYSRTALSGGDNVTLTVIPTGGAGTCFAAASASCTATACTPPTAGISYGGPFCSSIATQQTVTLNGTGTFTGGTYSAAVGLSLNTTTGAIMPSTSTPATYTVTYTIAAGGGCPGVTATTSVKIDGQITPTFTAVSPICSGATLAALPTTSLNGVTGTWSPALNNTATTTYTFAPSIGQCATTNSLTITVKPNIAPTFSAVSPICSGATLAALPTTSLNGIIGTWSPTLNNTATTAYTFTPSTGQCATTASLTISINPILSPTINCGVSTSSSVLFNWAAVTGATGYSLAFQINGGAVVNVGAIGNVLTYSRTSLSGGDNVTLAVTPTGGAGSCFAAASASCTATACTPPTAGISYGGPFCSSIATQQTVTLIGTGAFTGGTYSATVGLSLNTTNGAIMPSTSTPATYTVTYTIAVGGVCPGVTATTSVKIDGQITPTFAAVSPICSGATLVSLPTTSLNGITGTWSPALNNTATTTYTFAPSAGQCATTASLAITVNPNIAPTFTAISPICNGATLAALPTTSLNGITGTWSPALNNTATTTYTFAPSIGQCATTNSLTISINPILSPTINCGVSTSSSVLFNWAAVTGATGYSLAYQVNGGAVVNVGAIGNVLTYSRTALSGGDNVALTVTPTGGAATCFAAASASCSATACTPPTASISYGGPFCSSIATQQTVTLIGTGAFTGGTYSAAVGLSLNTTTGAIMPSSSTPATYTVTYTIAAGGGCPGVTATTSVKIDGQITPTFTTISPICSGATLAPLPTTSLNGITGTWSPALNNSATTTYTFAPSAGQCATTASLAITVSPNIAPTFTAVSPICSGATLAALPTTSLNGITGTWSPALNNTATTTYSFAPSAGQCATTASLMITVNPLLSPTINCFVSTSSSVLFNWAAVTGATGYSLAYQINGGVVVNVGAIGNVLTYSRTALSGGDNVTLTVTPTGGAASCFAAASASCPATACTPPTAGISYGGPLCSSLAASQLVTLTGTGAFTGGTYSAAAGLSLNTATGAITPSTSTPAAYTVTYTVAASGGCPGVTATALVKIDGQITPTFTAISPICSGTTLAALPTTSLNGITGTWSPALNNTATTTYTFTPSAGQCATTNSLTITVNPKIIPTFTAISPICSGATLAALPTTSLNGITGTWSPALNNTATTTYTFAPSAGQCATTASLTITVNPLLSPTINCGVSTSSSVSFNWAAVSGATGYSLAYQINAGAVVNVGAIGNVLTYSRTSLSGGDNVTLTVTPTGGSGTCFAAASASCTATACTPPTAGISYGGPFCTSIARQQTVTLIGTSAFTGGTYSATAGLSLNTATGAITPSTCTPATYMVTYTVAASGGCPGVTATASVKIDGQITPAFTSVAPICSGATLAALPTTSLNGITGTWSPALNNTATTNYTFTPSAGQCATTASLTITVNPLLSPTINCGVSTNSSVSFNWAAVSGATGYSLAYQINAGAVVNVGAIGNVLTYSRTALSGGDNVTLTVIPTGGAGTCFAAASASCTATACTPPTAGISYGGPFCSSIATQQTVTLIGTGAFTGGTYSAAAGLSLNTATGAITPSTSTPATYTVTYTVAASGGCPGVTATASVKIDGQIRPTFATVSPICSGATLVALPTTSLNGITGTWSPALNNTATTTYTFAPSAGQCATTASLAITINPVPIMPTVSIFQPTCPDPTGTVLLASAAPDLTFSLDGSAYIPYSVNGFNVAGGSHSLSVKNSIGCVSLPQNLVVNNAPLPPLAVATSITPASCGNSNGTLAINKVDGGVPPYLYSINNGAPAGALVYSNLSAGTYKLLVSDANLCTFETSFIISNTGGASLTATADSAFCGGNNGMITATGFGGTPPYQFTLNGAAYQASDTFTKIFPGTYSVTIKDANNCTQTAQVSVGDKVDVLVTAGRNFTICEGVSIKLTAASNATSFFWSPTAGLSDPAILQPVATPVITTKYFVTATAGNCIVKDSVLVEVRSAPIANAGIDAMVCFGNSYQLKGSGGVMYNWMPRELLSDPEISNPFILSSAQGTNQYILNVSDSNGCTGLQPDTVLITVLPAVKVFAGSDTSILINEPLQLHATDVNNSGFNSYLWSPSAGLNNVQVREPIAVIDHDTRYLLTARTLNGCSATDDILIKVFARSDLFVPTAFTPNRDGLNDILKVLPVGVRHLKYFTIYNRWGEIVFTTTDPAQGWDGVHKGVLQSTGTFVWSAEAIDYKGVNLKKKGTVILIR